jgi:Protein of unknown function (DUF3175)
MTERRKSATRKAARKAASRPTTGARKSSPKRWSQRVTKQSDALDLKRGLFKLTSAKKIAASLKCSAERSSRRKAGAYRSALSMLTFLHQPGRHKSAESPTRPAATRKDRIEASVRA